MNDKNYIQFKGKRYYLNSDNSYVAEDGESLPVSELKYDPATGTNYAVTPNGKILDNVSINLPPVDVYANADEIARIKARKNLDTATPYSAAQIMSQRDPYWRYKYDMSADMNTFNAISGGVFNLLSPTQVVRNIYNFITGKPTAFNEFVFGNNGVFTDDYAKEHPYIALGGNLIGDAFLGWSAAKGFSPTAMAQDVKNASTAAYNVGREAYYKAGNAMPFDNPNFTFSTYPERYSLYRIGDVDINRAASNYRQLKAGGARNFQKYIDTDPHQAQYAPNPNNTKSGLLALINRDMLNPMYKQGSLWYGRSSSYPDLLVTDEPLAYANSKSGISRIDQGGRRVPYSDAQITSANTTAYTDDPTYGYRRVGYFDGVQMPITGNTNKPTVFYSKIGDAAKQFAGKVKNIISNSKSIGLDDYAPNMQNNFRYNAFADKPFYANPVQEAITKTFESDKPDWTIFKKYKETYPEFENQFNNFIRTYNFQAKKIPYYMDYEELMKNNKWAENIKGVNKQEFSRESDLSGIFLQKGNNRAIYLNEKSQLNHELEHWLQSFRDVDGKGNIYFPQQEELLNEAYLHSKDGRPEARMLTEKGAVNQQVRTAILDKYYQENHTYPKNVDELNKYIDSQTDASLRNILKNETNAYGIEYIENELDFNKIRAALKYVPAVGVGFLGTKSFNSTK